MKYVFTLFGKPQRQQRPRFGRNRVYAPSHTHQEALGWEIKGAMGRLGYAKLFGPLRVKLAFFGTGRADLTNCAKLFEDAANGILWGDDRQILRLELSMERQSELPRTQVEVEELPAQESL